MIRDSRHMYGGSVHTTQEDIKHEWEQHSQRMLMAQGGFPNRLGASGLEYTNEQIEAYISDGRWVADCGTDACNGGIGVWPEMDEGCCYDCGRVFKIKFPPKSTRALAEKVLEYRGDSRFMNWIPNKEDIADLKAENATRGFPFSTSDVDA